MTDQPGRSRTDGVPLTRSFTADETTAGLMAVAMFRLVHRRPATWVAYLVFVVVGLGFWVATGMVGTVVVAVAVGVPWFAWLSYVRYLKGFRRQIRPGEVWSAGFGPTTIAVRQPGADAEIAYSALQAVHVVGDFVALQHRGAENYAMLPRSLFTGDDLLRCRTTLRG